MAKEKKSLQEQKEALQKRLDNINEKIEKENNKNLFNFNSQLEKLFKRVLTKDDYEKCFNLIQKAFQNQQKQQ